MGKDRNRAVQGEHGRHESRTSNLVGIDQVQRQHRCHEEAGKDVQGGRGSINAVSISRCHGRNSPFQRSGSQDRNRCLDLVVKDCFDTTTYRCWDRKMQTQENEVQGFMILHIGRQVAEVKESEVQFDTTSKWRLWKRRGTLIWGYPGPVMSVGPLGELSMTLEQSRYRNRTRPSMQSWHTLPMNAFTFSA